MVSSIWDLHLADRYYVLTHLADENLINYWYAYLDTSTGNRFGFISSKLEISHAQCHDPVRGDGKKINRDNWIRILHFWILEHFVF